MMTLTRIVSYALNEDGWPWWLQVLAMVATVTMGVAGIVGLVGLAEVRPWE